MALRAIAAAGLATRSWQREGGGGRLLLLLGAAAAAGEALETTPSAALNAPASMPSSAPLVQTVAPWLLLRQQQQQQQQLAQRQGPPVGGGARAMMAPPPPRYTQGSGAATVLAPRPPPDDMLGFRFAADAGSWEQYFAQRQDVPVKCGAGSGVTLQLLTVGHPLPLAEVTGVAAPAVAGDDGGDRGVAVLLLHGGGLSAMSWALVVSQLRREQEGGADPGDCAPPALLLALDLRAHGGSGGSEEELTIEQLCADTAAVIEAVVAPASRLVLVGHSLGGAVAVHVAAREELRRRVAGLVLVDITEDAAMGSLARMRDTLLQRPASFGSVSEGIAWCTGLGSQVSNPVSACVSMPAQLRRQDGDSSSAGGGGGASGGGNGGGWRWRTNLLATAPHWEGWFHGMDKLFLQRAGTTGPGGTRRVLVVNSLSSLGKELTVAQMQGQLQVEVAGTRCVTAWPVECRVSSRSV
jgi:protein phosphatase methylesterase 1